MNLMLREKIKISIDGGSQIDYSKDEHDNYKNQFLAFLEDSNFIVTSSENAEIFLLINYSRSAYRKHLRNIGDLNRCILLRTEPESIFPAQYKNRVTKKFGLVITTGQKLNNEKNLFYVNHPYSYLKNPNFQMSKGTSIESIQKSFEFDELFEYKNWCNRPINLSLIASNKVSCRNNSNYALRRKLASSFNPSLLEIYGEMWNKEYRKKLNHRLGVMIHGLRHFTIPNINSIYGSFFYRYKSHKGKVVDKHLIIKQSKFSLVVENSNSYVSEKLFDAMMNGSIPIYYGPDLEILGIQGNKLVLNGNNPNVVVEEKILAVTKPEVQDYLQSIKKFLKSEVFLNNWLDQKVYSMIATRIETHLRNCDDGQKLF